MELTSETTARGFPYFTFEDRYGTKCTLQESSLATEAAIWLGVDDKDAVKSVVQGRGWLPVELPKGTEAFTRMHLTREQVASLLPILNKFVETGEIV